MPVETPRIEYFRKPNGARVAYATIGHGPPVVVIPPWVYDIPSMVERFESLVAVLQHEHTVVFYDRQGSGLSQRSLEDWRFARHAEELEALLDHLGVAEAALHATSQAGPVALDFAATRPERVSRLLLISTYADGPATFTRADVQESMLSLVRSHWGIASKALADMLIPRASQADAEALAEAQRRSAEPEMAARCLEEIYRTDVSDRLPSITAPTMVVHHREDRAIPFAGGLALASGIAGARLTPLSGRGHAMVSREREPAVVDEIVEFLRVAGPETTATSGAAGLTAREIEVLRLVAEGCSNAEIAERLTISHNTVANHLKHVLAKTGATNRAAAASTVLRQGLI